MGITSNFKDLLLNLLGNFLFCFVLFLCRMLSTNAMWNFRVFEILHDFAWKKFRVFLFRNFPRPKLSWIMVKNIKNLKISTLKVNHTKSCCKNLGRMSKSKKISLKILEILEITKQNSAGTLFRFFMSWQLVLRGCLLTHEHIFK